MLKRFLPRAAEGAAEGADDFVSIVSFSDFVAAGGGAAAAAPPAAPKNEPVGGSGSVAKPAAVTSQRPSRP